MTIREDIKKFKKDVDYPVLFILALPVAFTISFIKQLVRLMKNDDYGNYHAGFTSEWFTNCPDNYQALSSSISSAKSDVRGIKLAQLRDYLYQNNFTLIGIMKKAIIPKIEYEDLCRLCLTKDYQTPYMLQNITFGEELNEIIAKAFNTPLHKNRKTKTTYFTFKNGETFDFESELKRLFYSDKIKIKIIDSIMEK